MSTTTATGNDQLIVTVQGALTEKLDAYKALIEKVTNDQVAARERHEQERTEMRERHLAEIDALRSDNGQIATMFTEVMNTRSFLSTLGVDVSSIVVPSLPGATNRGKTARTNGKVFADRKALIAAILAKHPDGISAPAITRILNPEIEKASAADRQAENNRVQTCLANGRTSGDFVSVKTGTGNANLWKLAAVATTTVDAPVVENDAQESDSE